MKGLLIGSLVMAICAGAIAEQTKKVHPPHDAAALGRHSFEELISVKDLDVLTALGRPHSYVCYRGKLDEFILVSFGPTLADYAWGPIVGNSFDEVGWPEYILIAEYRQGATSSTGIGLSVYGRWTRSKDSPMVTYFTGDAPTDPNNPSKSSNVDINDDEFQLVEEYGNIASGVTHYVLTIRRSTGRFTESYDSKVKGTDSGTLIQDSGRCSIFADGKIITEGPLQPN